MHEQCVRVYTAGWNVCVRESNIAYLAPFFLYSDPFFWAARFSARSFKVNTHLHNLFLPQALRPQIQNWGLFNTKSTHTLILTHNHPIATTRRQHCCLCWCDHCSLSCVHTTGVECVCVHTAFSHTLAHFVASFSTFFDSSISGGSARSLIQLCTYAARLDTWYVARWGAPQGSILLFRHNGDADGVNESAREWRENPQHATTRRTNRTTTNWCLVDERPWWILDWPFLCVVLTLLRVNTRL